INTAALVMRLVEQGSLNLADAASDFIPRLPEEITIGQLLSHTAGLRDVDVAAGIFEAIEAGGLPEQSRDAIDDALERGLVFEPGTTQSYSSVGYLALERVIEGVTGTAWDEALRQLVLPAEVSTHLEEDGTALPTPYERLGPASPAISLASLPTSGFARGAGAAGGLVSNATDIAEFVRALFAGEVVSAESLELMMDLAEPRDSYGFGLAFYDIGDTAIFGHNGRTVGFASSVRHDPVNGVTVVVLSNDGSAPTDELSNELILAAVSDR
ncbi:MAG: beta-lactamase family protein, partial [Acidimicrobiia bacterium]|nr:beta-lactamase family protein [Acidimicrobiia bacterium]